MEIPDEILKEIRESGYDQKLVYNYIRELLNSDKQINENRFYLRYKNKNFGSIKCLSLPTIQC